MIVVDTSVWIAHLRNQSVPAVKKLRDPAILEYILVGDIVLTEVLQGARHEKDAARLEADFQKFQSLTWAARGWRGKRREIIDSCADMMSR